MALVFAQDPSGDSARAVALASGWWLLAGTLTFSGSYATGGDTLDLSKLLNTGGTLRRVIPLGDARGNSMEYDKTNKKLKFYGAANTEVAAAAYNAAMTASAVDVAFLIKFG
jgi:hypothetical protein